MPSTYQSSGGRDREQFPEEAEAIGEDPARFLDVPLVNSGMGSSDFEMAAARIRGIDSIEVANAWLRVEGQLERGPRTGVIQRLTNRKDEIRAQTDADDPTPVEGDTTAATAGGDA